MGACEKYHLCYCFICYSADIDALLLEVVHQDLHQAGVGQKSLELHITQTELVQGIPLSQSGTPFGQSQSRWHLSILPIRLLFGKVCPSFLASHGPIAWFSGLYGALVKMAVCHLVLWARDTNHNSCGHNRRLLGRLLHACGFASVLRHLRGMSLLLALKRHLVLLDLQGVHANPRM